MRQWHDQREEGRWGQAPPPARHPAAARFAASLLLAAATVVSARAEIFMPLEDTTILEVLPTARDPEVAALRRAHVALARQPDNMNLAVKVARADILQARSRFDPRFNGYAQAALAPWWSLPEPAAPVRLLRAMVHQSNHDFAASLSDLDALVRERPRDPQVRLTRAVVHEVRGEFGLALADCAAVAAAGADFAARLCADSARGLGPDPAPAAADLAEATDDAGPDATPALRLWARTVLAEMAARRGDTAEAQRQFDRARAVDARDGYLLGAYGDWLLDQGRDLEVVDLLADQGRIDPLLLRLTLAEQRLKRPEAAAHAADLADRFAASAARGETVHRREQARFTLELLHQPQAALRLALANFAVQREPADARIALEAAEAAGDRPATRAVLDWLRASGLRDVALDRLAAAPGPAAPDRPPPLAQEMPE